MPIGILDAPVKRTCPVCGKVFETQSRDRVYCSDKCRDKRKILAARYETAKQHGLEYIPEKDCYRRLCEYCGKPFETKVATSVTCSDVCRRARHSQKNNTLRKEKNGYFVAKNKKVDRFGMKLAELGTAEYNRQKRQKDLDACGKIDVEAFMKELEERKKRNG